jgi:uncharacterized membrane protein
MTVPAWGLWVAYWLHMLATVVWIGSLASLSILVLPAARKIQDPQIYSSLLENIQPRMDLLGWLSLLVLIATGLVQMSANANYQGFLALTNRWAIAILIKHILFFLMIGVSTYMTWFLLPQLRRLALRRGLGQTDANVIGQAERLNRRETMLVRLNLILGVLVLAMTAMARAS